MRTERHLSLNLKLPLEVIRFVRIFVLGRIWLVGLAAGLGAAVRLLTVICFVLAVQALLLAALPNQGSSRLATAELYFSSYVGFQMDQALLTAIAVLVAYSLLFASHVAYQKVLGTVIMSTNRQLTSAMGIPQNDFAKARKLSSAAAVNSVKCLEISLFLVAIYLFLLIIDWRVALLLAAGCLLALGFLVLGFRQEVWRRQKLDFHKKSLAKNGQKDAYESFEENIRYRKGIGPGIEALTLGVVIASIVLALVHLNIDLGSHAVYAIVIVFSMRYAIVYTRDLARALTALFDLRTDPILKSAAKAE